MGLLLVIGWALLLPPPGTNSARVPEARWEYAGSFQSRAECEAIQAELIAAAHRPLGDPWMIPDLGDAVRIARATVWDDSRCVPRDEPAAGSSTHK
jgi:hypothetical protein